MAWMINNCSQLNFSDGGAGAFTIKVALGKVGIDPMQAIVSVTIVYISNFIGAALMAGMINNCGQLNFSDGGAGAFTIKVALGKVGIDSIQAIVSGILCNVLVCLAIFMAATAKDVAGKCIAIFFPIFVFVISGFEHCVANMYYIPAGIFAAHNPLYVHK